MTRPPNIARVSSTIAVIGAVSVGIAGVVGFHHGVFDTTTVILVALMAVCNAMLIRGYAWALYLLVLVLGFISYKMLSFHEVVLWPAGISAITCLAGLVRLTLLAKDRLQRLLAVSVAVVTYFVGLGLSVGFVELEMAWSYDEYRQRRAAEDRAEREARQRARREALRRRRLLSRPDAAAEAGVGDARRRE